MNVFIFNGYVFSEWVNKGVYGLWFRKMVKNVGMFY